MAPRTDTELWSLVITQGQDEVDWQKAWREVRKEGGRDLVKSEEDFQKIYERFQTQPLFAAQWLLNVKRQEFQQAIEAAVFSLPAPSEDAEIDRLMQTLSEFGKGSFGALLDILDTVAVVSPVKAEQLTATARALHTRPFTEFDARRKAAASTQLELPFQPEQQLDGAVPEVSPGV